MKKMIGKAICSFLFLMCLLPIHAVGQELVAGPMIGNSTHREVSIWVQSKDKAMVAMRYAPLDRSADFKETAVVMTHASNGFTATLVAENLEPGTTYIYDLIINGTISSRYKGKRMKTQPLWQWRTDPPDFNFLAGSCFYINETAYDRPGKPYGGDYQILSHMIQDTADFMLWLGDNTYLREVDWTSESGIYHRYTHTRSLPELQPLLEKMPHYAIWDDHDYGPNDADYTYPLKKYTSQAFKDFWPANGRIFDDGSITSSFAWADCQFFLLDNRWYRGPQDKEGTMLGAEQLQWLIDALRGSKSPFKFVAVGSQMLSDFADFENFANYERERQTLLDAIDKYQIKNVVFLTGDRHHSEISKLVTKSGIEIHDITSSSLTATAYDHRKEPNTLRIPDAIIGERNYALISVTGPRKERKLSVTFKNSDGKILLTQKLF